MRNNDFLIKSINSYKVLIDNQANIVRESADGTREILGKAPEVVVPTKVSQLENDVPYATTSELSKIPKFEIKVVTTLPTENISDTTVYLIPSINPKEKNLYEEWIYVDKKWEILGKQDIDLTQYVRGYKPGLKMWNGTQTQFDSISTKDADTIYFITE